MKHHYIPQFYLRPWLGPDHKLQEFRRGHGGRIQVGRYGTKVTGYADDLYTLPGVTGETKHNVERYFMSSVDNAAVRAGDMMLEDRLPADPDTRHSWSRFLLSLVFRNPAEVAKFKRQHMENLLTTDPKFHRRFEENRVGSAPSFPKTGWCSATRRILNGNPS